MFSKKYISLLFIITTITAFYVHEPEISAHNCKDNLTSSCLDKAISTFDFKKHGDKNAYKPYATQLTKAGFHEKALELLSKSKSSISYLDVINIAATKVAKDALLHPNKIADFEILKTLKNKNSPMGTIIANKVLPDDIDNWFYLKLSSKLKYTANSGGGDVNFVQFNDRQAIKRFRANATWNHLTKKWIELANTRNEPRKSQTLLMIASQLEKTGSKNDAYTIMKAIDINKISPVTRYTALLNKLGKDEESQKLIDKLGTKVQSTISKVNSLIESQQLENIESFIANAHSAIAQADRKELSGKDKAKVLRRLSKLIYDNVTKKELALKIAEQAITVEKNDSIAKSFIEHEDWSKHYRAIGQPEKAMAVMQQFASPLKNRCSAFTSLGRYAEEFYHLGRIDLAADKINEFCDSVSVFGTPFGLKSAKVNKKKQQLHAWSALYQDATITQRDTKEIIKYAGEEVINYSKPYLAMYYLNNNNKELGEQYLSDSINNLSSGNIPNCNLAYLANSTNRADLIINHLNKAIMLINNETDGLQRIWKYTILRGCHNDIELDRLRLPKT
jgi:hypothetical protein